MYMKEGTLYNVYTNVYTFMKLTSIQKWGNSFAVRLPKVVVDELGLVEGQEFRVERAEKGPGLSLIPAGNTELPLHKLLARITPDNQQAEVAWDLPQGKEVW